MKTSDLLSAVHQADDHVLKLFGNRKFRKVRNAYLTYRVVRPFYDTIKAEYDARSDNKRYIFRIENRSPVHRYLEEWMTRHLPRGEQDFYDVNVEDIPVESGGHKALTTGEAVTTLLRAINSDSSMEDCSDDPIDQSEEEEVTYKTVPKYTFTVEHPKDFYYKGVKITLEPDGIEDDEAKGSGETGGTKKRKKKSMFWNDYILSAKGIEGRNAIAAFLEEVVEEATRTTEGAKKTTYLITPNGTHWTTRGKLAPRTFENVFLPTDVRNGLIEDMSRFLAMRRNYERLGIPYHRGYLLYGEPGTGKTSIVQAMANHFELNVWAVSLRDVSSDNVLTELFYDLGSGCIVLLEDIDSISAARDAETVPERKEGISLGGLLNVLDGVGSGKGQIVFATTNHPERLDHRLLRPGRFDYKAYIGLLSEEQYYGFFRLFFETDPPLPWESFDFEGVSPAEMMECFKRYPLDIDAATRYLLERYGPMADKSLRSDIQLVHGIGARV